MLKRLMRLTLAAMALATILTAGARADEPQATTEMLSAKPATFGRPASDRAAWEAVARKLPTANYLAGAAKLLPVPLPEASDELYLDFSRTGNRDRYQRVVQARHNRLNALALAECLEYKGRFLPKLEETIRDICKQRTWVLPAHDVPLVNFQDKEINIDLVSSAVASNLATIDYLLGDKLSPETRRLIREEVNRRIFEPYKRMVAGQQSRYWLDMHHNWNSVCLAGVTASALGLIESPEERAWFVATAQQYSRNFLTGFTPDGYCSEGVGYWSYGFGHYVQLAEAIRQATANRIDLMARPDVLAPALYGLKCEIAHGVYPAFADCSIYSRPSAMTTNYVNQRYGLGMSLPELAVSEILDLDIYEMMMLLFPDAEAPRIATPPLDLALGERTWFDAAGILIARPGASGCRLAAALKGGSNHETHNHMDVGAFVLMAGKVPVIQDIGSEVYTRRTFSKQRYDSRALNSWGHSVPLIAGQKQVGGKATDAKVLKSEFTPARDTLVLDIAPAYRVKTLQKLERAFVFSREGAGSLTVTDTVALSQPETYETALMTFGKWSQTAPGVLRVEDEGEALQVAIDTGGVPFKVSSDPVKEDLRTRKKATRIAVKFDAPIRQATVKMTFTPLAGTQTASK